jgi:DNA-binding beta-propeller fold protein YncE
MARRFGATIVVIAGILTLIASGGGGGGGGGLVTTTPSGSVLYVVANLSNAVLSYNNANTVSGSTAPDRTLSGASTTLNDPRAVAIDMPRNQLYVANTSSNSILVFNTARTVNGDAVPDRTITNTAPTLLSLPTSIYLDVANDRLYIASSGNDAILIYDNASTVSGDIAPDRELVGAATTISGPTGVALDATRDRLYVTNINNQILVFANAGSTNGNIAPVGTISGASTTLNNPGALYVDPVEDRLYIANTANNSILVFEDASAANGDVTPDRTLVGAATLLSQPRALFVDLGTNRLYVMNGTGNTVLVFDAAATVTGDTAPARTLSLPAGSDPYGVFVDVTPIVLPSTATLDGVVRFDGAVATPVPTGTSEAPRTGDTEPDLFTRTIYRQFYSFSIAAMQIPVGSSVHAATLRLYQAGLSPDTPYGIGGLGNVIVDHLDYGGTLNNVDYSSPSLTPNIGTLSSNGTLGYKELGVTTYVQSDVTNTRQHSQYRLLFSSETNVDAADDYAYFTDAEDSCCTINRPPQLVITVEP